MIEEGFWRGDVKRNTSPPTGRPDRRDIVAASPGSVETSFGSRFLNVDRSSQRGVVSETEKQEGRFVVDHSSI